MGFPTEACFFYWVALCVDPQKRSTQTTTKLMLTLAREAMNTRFELVLPGDNIVAMRDLDEEDPLEIEASKYDLSYISLDLQFHFPSLGFMGRRYNLAVRYYNTILDSEPKTEIL